MTGFEPDFFANFRNWTDRPPQARKFSGCGLEIKEIDVKSDRPIGPNFSLNFRNQTDRPRGPDFYRSIPDCMIS